VEFPQQQVDEVKAKHGEAFLLEAADEAVVAVRPSREVWKRFRLEILDDNKQGGAMENLVRSCVVLPDKAQFDALLNKKPGLAESFGKLIAELAGSGGTATKKAL
jgi:hypothetical protein